MNDLIGQTLKNRFRVTAPLGEGAMGTVYRGVEIQSGRDVAIKVMHPGLMKEPGMLTRFRREASAMRRVRHENAIEVLAHGVDQGLVYLVMELAQGSDLAARIRKERRFSAERALRIVSNVLSALAEAHAHGVIHRDVKPENIMIGHGDAVKIIDFGIAKPTSVLSGGDSWLLEESSMDDSIEDDVHLASGFDLTSAGTLVGSPGYMAPEQWASGAVDARTDIYACGVLLYELVTGHLPFEDENPFLIASRQLSEEPVPAHTRNPHLRPALSDILRRALRPRPEDRFQSAAEMRDTLCAHLVDLSITSVLELGATVPFAVISPLAAPPPEPPKGVERLLPCAPFERTIVINADSDFPPVPAALAARRDPLPAEDAPTQPFEMGDLMSFEDAAPAPAPRLAKDAAPAIAPLALPLADAPEAARSSGRNGRKSPIPPAPVALATAPARSRSARPAAARPALSHVRVVLPLAAAFLALGVALGIVLFLPVL